MLKNSLDDVQPDNYDVIRKAPCLDLEFVDDSKEASLDRFINIVRGAVDSYKIGKRNKAQFHEAIYWACEDTAVVLDVNKPYGVYGDVIVTSDYIDSSLLETMTFEEFFQSTEIKLQSLSEGTCSKEAFYRRIKSNCDSDSNTLRQKSVPKQYTKKAI